MEKYHVEITEVLRRTITVNAETADDAIGEIESKYYNGEIVLGSDDFQQDADISINDDYEEDNEDENEN